MSIRWKFWRRADSKRAAAPATAPASPQANEWMPLTTARELLGLQRVVGNQAVLALLAGRKVEGPPPSS